MARSIQSVALAVAAAGFANAVNTPPPIPLDSQIGKLHFPVTCQIFGFLNQTFDTIFTATAPVYGGTGQEIYYTDVTGSIDVPSYITGLAPLVQASQASANISVYLSLINASPSNPLAYQGTIENIKFPSGQDAIIRIPVGTGVLPPIGPITLGTPNVAHRISLGDISVSIELQNSTGANVFGPLPVSCNSQPINYVIGSVNVNSTQGGAPLKPSLGYAPAFPPTPNQTESGFFRFPYDCVFGPLGNQNLDLIIGGTIGTYFKPSSQFFLSNAQGFLRIPASLISLAKQAYPSATTFNTMISDFEILATNASPAMLNAAKTAIDSTVAIPASSTGDLLIPIPATGYLPAVGPFTAGADGTIVGIAVGRANATTSLTDSTGKSLFSFDVTCNVPSPLELIGVPVTSVAPGNYSLGASHPS